MITDKKIANTLMDKRFASVVGMDAAKARIRQIVLGAMVDKFVPPILILATAGLGKTRLLLIIASLLKDVLGRVALWFPRGEDCGTRLKFVEECLIPRFHDKAAFIAIDECHECKPNVSSLLRSMIEVTAERTCKTVRACGDYEITYNPELHTVLLATNKVEKLDRPLMSRFEIIRLPLYTDAQMIQIVELTSKKGGVKIAKNAVKLIAECNRGSARDVVQWLDSVKAYLNATGKKELDEAGAREVIRVRETFPMGVNNDELQTLLLLEANGEMQLKELAGRNNVSSTEQNANETYLRQRGLIHTRGTRSLSGVGAAYLLELRKLKFVPELKAGKQLPVDAPAQTKEAKQIKKAKGAK